MSVYGMIGIVGVGFYLGSYALLQFGILRGAGFTYTILNLIAACCVAISLFDAFNLSSLVIQMSWITISLIGLTRIYLFRYLHRFSLEDRKFGDAVVPTLDDQELRHLLKIGTWETLPAGTTLTEQGQPIEALVYIASGGADVERGGKVVARMAHAQFIGEITCMTGVGATATTKLVRDSRVLRIPVTEFRHLMRRRTIIREHLEFAFAHDMRRKLSDRFHLDVAPDEFDQVA